MCPGGGCPKVACRSEAPKSAPLIMEKDQAICKSPEHRECLRFIDGNAFQQARRDAHIGCPFLSNSRCGKPNEYWCHGFIPPFVISEANNLESCKTKSYESCPNYVIGVREAEAARKLLATG